MIKVERPIKFVKDENGRIKVIKLEKDCKEEDIRFMLDVYSDELTDELVCHIDNLKQLSIMRTALESLVYRDFSKHFMAFIKQEPDTAEGMMSHDSFYTHRRKCIDAVKKISREVGEKCERIEEALGALDEFEVELNDSKK